MDTTETKEEKKSLRLEILEKVSALATAGLGLVAALAWNDAIQEVFKTFFPGPSEGLVIKLVYALVITIIIVLITIYLGRLVNLAKKPFIKDEGK